MSTVGKLVILKLDGDFSKHGFRVTLEISSEGDRPSIEVFGKLPPDPELVTNFSQWQKNYRSLGKQNRLEPIEMTCGGSVNDLKVCRQSADTLRDRMKAWLDSQSFHSVDKRLREELSVREPIRFLICTQDRYLRYLPWHYWDFFERYSQAEFALAPLSYEQVKVPTNPANKKEKVKILAILGNSAGIDIEKDRSFLENLDEHAQVVFLVEKSRQEINNQLWEQSWDILFFVGHSKSKTKEEKGIIEINAQEKLTINELKYGLRQAIVNGLQLGIFNSCDGLGLAYELEQLNLPQLILMRQPVPDQVAQEFLKHFLRGFASGDSLYVAERKAREWLQGLEGEFPCASWLPVICQNPASVPPTWQELVGNGTNIASNLTQPLVDNTQTEEGQDDKLPGKNYLPDRDNSDRSINLWHRLGTVFLASTLVTALVMGVRSQGKLKQWEYPVYDQMMRLRGDEGKDHRLMLVTIDDTDIKYQQEQGWNLKFSLSDEGLASLLQELDRYEPSVIGLYVPRDIGVDQNQKDLKARLEKDHRLYTSCFATEFKNSGIFPPPRVPEKRQGFVNIVRDSDGIVRRHLLSMGTILDSPCTVPRAFSTMLAFRYLHDKNIKVDFQKNSWIFGDIVLRHLQDRDVGYSKNETEGSQILLNYRTNNGSTLGIVDAISLKNILQDKDKQISPSFKNRIIIIGVTTSSDKNAGNRYPTPYSISGVNYEEIPELLLHAQMTSQLLSAVLDNRPLLKVIPQYWEFIWVLGWSLMGGMLVLCLLHSKPHLALIILAGSITICILYGMCYSFLLVGYLVSFVPSVLSIFATSASIPICFKVLFHNKKYNF